MTSVAALQHYLDTHIPITRALGIEVLEVTADRVRLAAPLAPNLNHRQTAFGGSVAALAILAGWGWLHARLAASGTDVRLVIQHQEMDYLQPVTGRFEAVCAAPEASAWQRFSRMLASRGRGRLELAAEVRADEAIVATFRGVYVAIAAGAPTAG